jgi:hypothetical protein
MSKITRAKRNGGVAQVVELLTSQHFKPQYHQNKQIKTNKSLTPGNLKITEIYFS